MSINIEESVYNYVNKGYSEEHARSRVTQDIILHKIALSSLKDKITIKGGVVMFNLTGYVRRATLDIDIDFIRYSINVESIERFFQLLNQIGDNVKLILQYPIKELNQSDYKGKRILFSINDSFNNRITNAKIDIHDRINRILKNPVFARNASKPNNDWIE